MLPSNEHTFILQIVNTYSHGYVTSQCDITYISWTYWVQILPINVQYYQSAFMPFIECIALLLLELQDPLYYESLYKAGFYVRESTALCCWRDGRTVGSTPVKGAALCKHPKRWSLCQEGPAAADWGNSVYQTLAVGGRSVEDNEFW